MTSEQIEKLLTTLNDVNRDLAIAKKQISVLISMVDEVGELITTLISKEQ